MQRRYLLAGAATVLLTGTSLTALAAIHDGQPPSPGRTAMLAATRCTVPALPGQQVTVLLGDMGGGMMGAAGMMGTGMAAGRMMVHAVPQSARVGAVSLRAINHGARTHELIVFPLAAGSAAGSRPVGPDNRIDEIGAVGEASNDCGAGDGDGIRSGGAGWVTLTVQPGSYELACNLPGHYAAGMHTQLTIG